MIQKNRPSLIIVAGPTASGKSAYAMALAKQCNGVIINADSLQVYAGLPLLTAQPTEEDKRETPHRMYGHVLCTHAYNVRQWLHALEEELLQISPKQTPILVGGTGFYLYSFCHGLSEIPNVPRETNEQCTQTFHDIGGEAFREQLMQCDPVTAKRLHHNDRQRLVRAMSVFVATGKSLSDWQNVSSARIMGDAYAIQSHILLPPRDVLRARAAQRFQNILDRGGVDEVSAMVDMHSFDTLSPTLARAIGVVPIMQFLKGDITQTEMMRISIDQTNQYIKRQTTWLRHHRMPAPKVVDGFF
ncbi:MAG: tRNA (adenosine(37)-N6)-dimethylallyltransferase MiaA [Alphaproteobacteria bacterium]|nr:MAG: tRNA (adenosine(37)-N6)-dimethylallyltransferase MiaA [Alphaproteobacteria bacterium]